ncbi:RepB family plasmid replication initiator protein [Gigaspora margarita]|uniref:RepB family plasmid replication initiator protein n=1 Tax=Gigaspora margarita TaxID=4874 RepID=A0A8H3ZXZ4_GIGMA|nr:RepB family plasmid replication initiator protein [Gigaspora margarita]
MHAKALSENENRHLAERHVTLRNDLVAASHGLKTLTEQRIVKSCAAKLDSVRIDQGRYKIKLTATEYAETFNLDPTTAYEQLKSVSTTLLDRMIRREEQTKRGFRPRGDTLPRDATRQPYDLPVETGGGLALDLFVAFARNAYAIQGHRMASDRRRRFRQGNGRTR